MKSLIRTFFFSVLVFWTALLSSCLLVSSYDGPPSDADSIDVSKVPNAVPKWEPKSKYGNKPSYVVHGQRYYVMNTAAGYSEMGIASWYGMQSQHQRTSNGESYDVYKMTAAHKSLPLPTYVRVTNLANHRQVVVRVNDRGPFIENRIIDLSFMAAKKLGMTEKGTAIVRVDAIDTHHPLRPVFYAQKSPSKTLSSPKLYIQVGTYSQLANAQKAFYKAKSLSVLPPKIYASKEHGSSLYRVQVGPVFDVAMADHLIVLMKSEGFGQAVTVVKT